VLYPARTTGASPRRHPEARRHVKFSSDLLLMFVFALVFTVVGFVTGAQFFVILCGSCLALCTLELFASRGRASE
jgi:hypothetical protein